MSQFYRWALCYLLAAIIHQPAAERQSTRIQAKKHYNLYPKVFMTHEDL